MLCNKSAGGVGGRGLSGPESAGPRQEDSSSCIQTPAPGIAAEREEESARSRGCCVCARECACVCVSTGSSGSGGDASRGPICSYLPAEDFLRRLLFWLTIRGPQEIPVLSISTLL